MAVSDGRISEPILKVFAPNTYHYPNSTIISKVVVSVFFNILLAAATRITTRLWLQKHLRLDDCPLLFSCVCFISATGLLYYVTPSIYFVAELTFDLNAVAAPD